MIFKQIIMNYSFLNKLSEKQYVAILLCPVLCFEALLGLQGFNVTDEGWVLSGYQQIFNDPSSVESMFVYYNTLLLGGLWNIVLGHYGIFAFRLLNALIVVSMCGVLYVGLRNSLSRFGLFIGVWLCVLCPAGGTLVFHHNTLTALINLVICFLFVKGINSIKIKYIFIAFILVGFNVFTRIPNITSLSLLVIFVIWLCINREKTLFFRFIIFSILGFVCGIIFVVCISLLLGHTDIIINSLVIMKSAGSSAGSSHNLTRMFFYYITDNYFKIAVYILFISILTVIVFAIEKIQNRKSKLLLLSLVEIACTVVLYIIQGAPFYLYAVASAVALFLLYKRHYDTLYLILTCIIIGYAMPMGSDFGIGNMGTSSVWLLVPILINVIFYTIDKRIETQKTIRCSLIIILLPFMVCQLIVISNSCYGDAGSRVDKLYRINNKLATVYTDKENVEEFDEVLSQLDKYIEKDDYILCFKSLPMIHYLTETRPYLYNPFVWTYMPDVMEKQVERAETERNELPVVLVTNNCLENKGKTIEINKESTNVDIFESFIKKHSYHIVWQNNKYSILLSGRKDN